MIPFLRAEARWLLAGFLLCLASSFGQTYFISLSNGVLMARFGLSHGGIGLVDALATTTSALILLEFGKLVDRVSARTAAIIVSAGLAGACLPMALGMIALALGSGFWVVWPVMVLIGFTAGFDSALSGAIWPELFGLKYLGELRALTFAFVVGASAVSPLLTGYLIDQGITFPTQLLAMGLYILLASGLMLLLQPRLLAIASDATAPA